MRCALATLGPLCLASAVWASWQVIAVPGVPADLEIGDAGVPEWYAIATSSGSYGFVGDAGAGTAVLVASVGVVLDTAQSCFGSLASNQCHIVWSGACNPGSGLSAGFSNACLRVRNLIDGGAFLVAQGVGAGGNFFYSPTRGRASADWSAEATGLMANPGAALGIFHGASVDDGVVLALGANYELRTCDSTTSCTPFQVQASLTAATDMELLGSGTPAAALIAEQSGALERVDLDGGAPVAVPLPSPLSQGGGLSFGQGADVFGMLAGTLADGGPAVFSAVPDPSNPARTWLANTVPLPALAFTTGFRHLRCLDGRVCVVLTDGNGTQNVLLYHNDFPPDAGLPASIAVVSNTSTVYSFDGGDDDGDAIFLSWNAPDGGVPFGFSVQGTQGLDIVVDAGAGPACGSGPQSYPFTVVASDGYAPHDRVFTVPFVVSSVGSASPPLVSPDGGLIIVQAGSQASVDLSFSVPDGGCPAASFNVTALSTIPGVTVLPGTASATVNIPKDWCSPDAGVSTFLVAPQGAVGDAGTVVEIEVLPWGVPLDPLDSGTEQRTQIAGTTVRYGPEQTHVCDDGGTTFPGVQTVWSVIPPLPAGATVVDAGNNAVDVTLGCAPQGGPLGLSVFNLTRGSAEVSQTDQLNIVQSLAFPPLGSLGLSAGQAEPVPVTLTLTPPPPCAAQRGLYAAAALEYLDGGLVSQGQGAFDAGGVAFVSLAYPGCNGGQFLVTGAAFFDGGAPGPVAQTQQISAPALRAEIADAGFVSPIAQCGGPANGGSITAFPPAQDGGICLQLAWSWAQNVADGGPHLANLGVNGPTLPLATVETGFGLIGDSLDLIVSAQGRPGDVATLERSVPILAPLFIAVTHQTDTARPEEASAFGVRVTLTNTSDCDVAGVDFQEMADNMNAVPGTAQAGGMAVGVGGDGATLVYSGLAIPAHGSLGLTYLARPKLLADPSPHGLALIKDVPISADSGLPTPPSGCGCTGVPSASALVGLALLSLVRRRRQKL
jgi:uncharacterized protein (TIGR03382 family)